MLNKVLMWIERYEFAFALLQIIFCIYSEGNFERECGDRILFQNFFFKHLQFYCPPYLSMLVAICQHILYRSVSKLYSYGATKVKEICALINDNDVETFAVVAYGKS